MMRSLTPSLTSNNIVVDLGGSKRLDWQRRLARRRIDLHRRDALTSVTHQHAALIIRRKTRPGPPRNRGDD